MSDQGAPSIEAVVARARRAQAIAAQWDQPRVDQAVAAVGWYAYHAPHAALLGKMGYRETGMGDPQQTTARLRTRVRGSLSDLASVRTVGVVEHDEIRNIRKVARPVGVIAAATPATAPAAGVFGNLLPMLKGRNAVIVTPNPGAASTAARSVDLAREALARIGAPEDLVQVTREPSRSRAEALMEAADLVVATGGAGTVRRAYRSGTPAYGAGPGNAVVVVDETAADLEKATGLIAAGKSFDCGTSCSSESSVLVESSRFETVLEHLVDHSGHVCTPEQAERLRACMWTSPGQLNRDLVGRCATRIADAANIDVGSDVRFLIVPRALPEEHDDAYACEKLAPILAVWRYSQFDEAVDAICRFVRRSGHGHSCGIHTQRADRVLELALRCDVSRVMVNQSTGFGNSGSFENGMPFTATISCGSWGGSSISENLNWRHFLNYTWISGPAPRPAPQLAELFAACRDELGGLPD